MDLNTLLFAGKWAFIGLVYFILITVVVVVRRELRVSSRAVVQGPVAAGQVAPGHLRVLNPGRDPQARPGSLIPLKPETSLGAEQDNDIVLGDPFISGHHARLRWDGSAWWVEDLGSTNGTLVNEKRCPPRAPQLIPPRGRLGLGDMVLELLA